MGPFGFSRSKNAAPVVFYASHPPRQIMLGEKNPIQLAGGTNIPGSGRVPECLGSKGGLAAPAD